MGLHRTKWALAGALALMVVGCAADAADDGQIETAEDDTAPAAALVLTQSDVTSADEGTSVARPTTPTAPSGLGDETEGDDGEWGGSDPSGGNTTPARPDPARSGGAWDAASVSRFCFLLDQRMQFLCRVTLTDCTKPARPLDIFTQVLCQLRGFLPGAPSSSTSSSGTRPSTGESSDVASGL